jgi:ketosteroid isomerase-like protein
MTHQELYQRYLYAGALTRDADAYAELFTDDGVLESPLVPPGHAYPHRLEGRKQIRAGMAAFYERSAAPAAAAGEQAGAAAVDRDKSGFVLHETADPDVFIAEVDTVLNGPDGSVATVSLVQVFRVRDGKIARLRDYFSPAIVS